MTKNNTANREGFSDKNELDSMSEDFQKRVYTLTNCCIHVQPLKKGNRDLLDDVLFLKELTPNYFFVKSYQRLHPFVEFDEVAEEPFLSFRSDRRINWDKDLEKEPLFSWDEFDHTTLFSMKHVEIDEHKDGVCLNLLEKDVDGTLIALHQHIGVFSNDFLQKIPSYPEFIQERIPECVKRYLL